MTDYRERLRQIRTFPSLIKFLRDELDWPIIPEDFEELTFDYSPEELGIDTANAAKIQEIKRLRPLAVNQPWGIFFVKFEPKRLPIVALRRILRQVVMKKRASANSAERASWQADDLLFISKYGRDGDERRINFVHFAQPDQKNDLPTLKVLGWDTLDTGLHLDHVANVLAGRLAWPDDEEDVESWRESWRSAFTLRHEEVIDTSKTLAVRLADLAQAIRDQIKDVLPIETKDGPLTKIMKAIQEALVHDLDVDGFADMYAQTIAYGLLAARVENPGAKTPDDFAAQMPITNPFLKELMETFLNVGESKGKGGDVRVIDFDELGVSEIVELLYNPKTNMEAVLRDFGDLKPEEDPVVHFYELFLKEYDPHEKVKRGIFYTPRPVVSYIVRSVDELLRTEFGLANGLADTTTWGEMAERHEGLIIPGGTKPDEPFVQVLDPATGTGTFLVEVIDLIHKTMTKKWQDKGRGAKEMNRLWNDYVPRHLLPRLYGYELLMAPYAIAHMKIGLKLYETGYRFGSDERVRVYLTNALEPAQDFSDRFASMIPALAHEAQAVNSVKRNQRFTVVIGNPPYAGISSNMTKQAQKIVAPYKIVDGAALNERKLWLQDDYVKFIRTAQTTIEQAHTGILGYITNNGYLGNPTFRGMRQSLMATFQRVRVLDLHGNANKKEQSPDGSDDKNVFDIRQGVSICLTTRAGVKPLVQHFDLWGTREAKYAWLSGHSVGDTSFPILKPDSPYYFFEPRNIDYRLEYNCGWRINDLMPLSSAGFITARDHFVVAFDRNELLARIADFADPELSDVEIRAKYFAGCGSEKYPDGDTRGWKLAAARKRVQTEKDWEKQIEDCLYRPFDKRFVYWSEGMIDWPRPEVTGHMLAGTNIALLTARSNKASGTDHFFCSKLISEAKCAEYSTQSAIFPLFTFRKATFGKSKLSLGDEKEPNLSSGFLKALSNSLRIPQTQANSLPKGITPEDIFFYAYAVFHSPGYRRRYLEFLKIDFPRLPLTSSLELFHALARLGGDLVAFHLVEAPVQHAIFAQCDTSAKAWRYEVQKGYRLPVALTFTGPAEPIVEKAGWSNDTVWLDAVKAVKGKGKGSIGFRGVPEDVWNFHIGGYQVCHKWLKDRKGRTLSADDLTHYHCIVIALHETIRLMKEIDKVIDQHGGWPAAFANGGPGRS